MPHSAHVFGERFPIRSGKIQQVCLENALANAYYPQSDCCRALRAGPPEVILNDPTLTVNNPVEGHEIQIIIPLINGSGRSVSLLLTQLALIEMLRMSELLREQPQFQIG